MTKSLPDYDFLFDNNQWRAQGVGIGGERSAEDAPFWCIIAVDILGAGTEVCPPPSAKHESYEGSISLKQHFCLNFSISGNLTILR